MSVLGSTGLFYLDQDEDGHASKRARTTGAKIRVCGVPEHFNMPWHIATERGIFAKHGVDVEFIEEACGTGAMIAKLENDEVDVIVALTEGLVLKILGGSDMRLLGTYVGSPLCWAISAAGQSSPAAGRIKSIADLEGGKFGVSRLTSGSHLMATVLASERGWSPAQLEFPIHGGIQGLLDGVNDGSSDAFLWETFTTKPYHDSGEVTRIGDISTPWPCFMLAAKHTTVTAKLDELRSMLTAVHEAARIFHSESHMPATVAKRYNLKAEDALAWFATVEIQADRFVAEGALERVVDALKSTGAVGDVAMDFGTLIDPRVAEIKRDIRSMKLYNKPELVTALHRQLKKAGLASGPANYTDFVPFDQHHYHGTDAVNETVAMAGITAKSRVINVGSGLGGPARYLAGKVGCQVLACELLDDLHQSAKEITERCSLGEKVLHLSGNFLSVGQHLHPNVYDSIVSWLTVLHIERRSKFFQIAYSLLRPGGVFFAADFFQLGKLTSDEWRVLKEDVSCTSLVGSVDEYKAQLEAAGFKIREAKDVTVDWRQYTSDRVDNFLRDQHSLEAVMGPEIYASLLKFYTAIRDLYQGGNLGGIEIYAEKPLGW
eukprot:m.434320 g.434320  ORF g.434320 m.434320 type:complete len:603 (+) comp17696_c0_seq1:64-1872(+)